jgi:alpha-mannosidase
VALLNDGRYGYDARENTLRLSLLRSPVRPDWECDQGEHELVYSLLPHAGGWRQAQVDRAGYELNAPALAVALPRVERGPQASLPATQAHLEADSRSLIAETLKQAEAGEALVLRTFDSHGCHARLSLTIAGDLEAVAETDLLEEHPQPVALTGRHSFVSHYCPYEIKTHRLTFARQGPREATPRKGDRATQ